LDVPGGWEGITVSKMRAAMDSAWIAASVTVKVAIKKSGKIAQRQ
jgi:hypothetical protein